MLQAVLFDLDGTLLDRDASLARFVADQHQRLHRFLGHIPQGEYLGRFVALDARGYVWKDRVYQQLVAEYGVAGISWAELLADYEQRFAACCVPFPHLHETLAGLKAAGLRLGLITNGHGAFQMANVRALGIEPYFASVLVSETEGVKKPDGEIFRRALARLQVAPAHSLYVGDHPVNDVAAAQQVGMRAVWKRDRGWAPPATADGVVDDLLDILAWVHRCRT